MSLLKSAKVGQKQIVQTQIIQLLNDRSISSDPADFAIPVLRFLTNLILKVPIIENTVDSRYLDFGYLEQPLISKTKSVPCLNLTSGNKILWIRGEIAPQEQFLPFPTIFSIYISN